MTPISIILYPLGSMGWIPGCGFETSCFAFFRGTELIVLDAGTGLGRLLELQKGMFRQNWQGLTHVRIFLTHYHLDHIGGLFWIKGIFGNIPVTVYGPGADYYGRSTKEILDGVFCKPYAPHLITEAGLNLEIRDLDPNGMILPGGSEPLRISVRPNPGHSDLSVSYRFGDLFAFVTDTPPEDELIGFVRGVRVLLMESWLDSSSQFESEDDPLDRHAVLSHTGSFGAGLIAKRAGVNRLYFVHHNPERKIEEIDSDAVKVSAELGIDCRASKDMEGIEV
jgi:ribonuclease BN (tRNA processing enzyme)